jgi:hypothetical protein
MSEANVTGCSKPTARLASRFEQRSYVFSAEKTSELVPRKIFAAAKIYSRANLGTPKSASNQFRHTVVSVDYLIKQI